MRLFDYGRAAALMDQAGIDVILASSKHNVGYLADYWYSGGDEYYVLWDTSVTHKTLVGIPKEEEKGPFCVPAASEMTALEAADPWIKDRRYWGPGYYIQTWSEPDPEPGNPMDVAAEALAEKGFTKSCIAVEMRYLGVAYFERLRALLPQASFLDAEAVLWNLRVLKCAEEIRRTRDACRRTASAWRDALAQVAAGITEKQMERLLIEALVKQGLEYERSYCIFGPAGLKLKNGPPLPSDTPLKPGHVIRTDVQARYEGYMCNLSRVAAFGKIGREMEQAHATVQRMVETLLSFVRPGRSCAEIREFELDMYTSTPYLPVVPYTGHGVGRVVHEPPYLSTKDPTLLKPGMVITVEPTICFRDGGEINISLEEQLLITDTGSECLTSDATLDLYL